MVTNTQPSIEQPATVDSSEHINSPSITPEYLTFRDHLYSPLGIADEMNDPRVEQIINQVKSHSMVHETGIEFTIASAIYAIKNNIPGVFVEFGTWRGGCSAAILLAQRAFFGQVTRPVYMFDSFEGLPSVTEKDGPLANEYQLEVDSGNYHDNCRAAQEDLESLLELHGFCGEDFKIVRGWFASSVEKTKAELAEQKIAVLRLDGDWYESTTTTLNGCCPAVSEEGIVIVDDYYAWDGCARAVHEYLTEKDLPYRIKSLPHNFGAFFVKRLHRKNVEQF